MKKLDILGQLILGYAHSHTVASKKCVKLKEGTFIRRSRALG